MRVVPRNAVTVVAGAALALAGASTAADTTGDGKGDGKGGHGRLRHSGACAYGVAVGSRRSVRQRRPDSGGPGPERLRQLHQRHRAGNPATGNYCSND